MLIVTQKITVNFGYVVCMEVKKENLKLVFDNRDYVCLFYDSSENAHRARRLIESAYAHGEKICKI